MKLPKLSFTVLDTETTGFVPKANRIIEFASVQVKNGKVTHEYEHLYSIDEDIPPHVQVITRIRPDMLNGQPPLMEQREEIWNHIGDETLIVGQNVSFDIGMLKAERIDLTDKPWVDTSMLASLVYPELASYSLGYLSQVLELNHEPAHRALGDVHATLELLSKIWERLYDLPDEKLNIVKDIFGKSSEGYRMLAKVLPEKGGKGVLWEEKACRPEPCRRTTCCVSRLDSAHRDTSTVTILEDTLSPCTLESLMSSCAQDTATVHWIAVKNLEAAVERTNVPEDARVLYPPFLLPEQKAVDALLKQDFFTADEATLAIKLRWFSPATREDIALHGDEKDIWSGRLAASEHSPVYLEQFQNLPATLLLDHRQLLRFITDNAHPAHAGMQKNSAIIIDDASMLEDTATKAYGHFCAVTSLRAAAERDAPLTSFVDLLEIWIEKVRSSEDIHFLEEQDFGLPETKGLREKLDLLLERHDLPDRTVEQLQNLYGILHASLKGNLVWIEEQRRGSAVLHAAPENIAHLLTLHLYKKHSTTLLLPPHIDPLTEILPVEIHHKITSQEQEHLPIHFPDRTLSDLFADPPTGKTIVLISSKRMIEDLFVRYTEPLEQRGTILLCQGMGGGLGRMQAEFAALDGAVIWLLTPWMYEGVELPENLAHHLIIDSLPFDHPSDVLIKARSTHFENAFTGYMIPRLKCRLFRLLRTFCRHKTERGDVHILDKRLEQKRYGKDVKQFLEQFQEEEKREMRNGEQMSLL